MRNTCSVPGCMSFVHGNGYCNRHYLQSRTNKGITTNARTKREPNEFVLDDVDCHITLFDDRGNEIAKAVIDAADIDLVRAFKWRLIGKKLYVHSWKCKAYLHNVIAGGIIVDHIDGNPLNNRRANLRLASISQNGMNRGKQTNNTSGYKGVTFNKRNGKWAARICTNGVTKHIGYFDDAHSASLAYSDAAARDHGRFAKS